MPFRQHIKMVWATGFGPATSAAQAQRSTRLSYTQIVARSTITTGWNISSKSRIATGRDVLCIFLASGVCQTGIWTLDTAQMLVLQSR